MKTYEMVALAEKDDKTYYTGDMAYQKDIGFVDKENFSNKWTPSAWGMENGLQKFVLYDGWQKLEPKEMTIQEIEKELGYKIKIINNI